MGQAVRELRSKLAALEDKANQAPECLDDIERIRDSLKDVLSEIEQAQQQLRR